MGERILIEEPFSQSSFNRQESQGGSGLHLGSSDEALDSDESLHELSREEMELLGRQVPRKKYFNLISRNSSMPLMKREPISVRESFCKTKRSTFFKWALENAEEKHKKTNYKFFQRKNSKGKSPRSQSGEKTSSPTKKNSLKSSDFFSDRLGLSQPTSLKSKETLNKLKGGFSSVIFNPNSPLNGKDYLNLNGEGQSAIWKNISDSPATTKKIDLVLGKEKKREKEQARLNEKKKNQEIVFPSISRRNSQKQLSADRFLQGKEDDDEEFLAFRESAAFKKNPGIPPRHKHQRFASTMVNLIPTQQNLQNPKISSVADFKNDPKGPMASHKIDFEYLFLFRAWK